MSESPSWRITGEWFDNCSCAVACPLAGTQLAAVTILLN
jgi:hypothetical protein